MLTKFFVKMQNKMQAEEGQGLVEYALIIVLVALIAIVGLQVLGPQVNTVFDNISTELQAGAS